MNNIIDTTKNTAIDAVAQFLLLNSEAFKKNELNDKISLIYFLFAYNKKYIKEYYDELAFEILEDVLIKELSTIEDNKGEDILKLASLGWSLIKFIEESYFEFDGLEEILSKIDKLVFLEVKGISNTGFEIDNINQLIGLGLYLKVRTNLLKKDKVKFLEAKEYLSMTFFELIMNIPHLTLEKIELLGLCNALFSDGVNNDIIGHFCIDGLKKMDKLIVENHKNKIIDNYKVFLKEEKFEIVLALNMLFPNLVKDYPSNLFFSVELHTKKIMKDLYQIFNHKKEIDLQKLLICGISMIKGYDNNDVKENSFECYLLGFLANSICNN